MVQIIAAKIRGMKRSRRPIGGFSTASELPDDWILYSSRQ